MDNLFDAIDKLFIDKNIDISIGGDFDCDPVSGKLLSCCRTTASCGTAVVLDDCAERIYRALSSINNTGTIKFQKEGLEFLLKMLVLFCEIQRIS